MFHLQKPEQLKLRSVSEMLGRGTSMLTTEPEGGSTGPTETPGAAGDHRSPAHRPALPGRCASPAPRGQGDGGAGSRSSREGLTSPKGDGSGDTRAA